jgi:hypothetical protein
MMLVHGFANPKERMMDRDDAYLRRKNFSP